MEICPATNQPYDSYLKVHKPSKKRTSWTKQLILDKVMAQMIKQGRPCVKTDDVTGDLSRVTFNLLGHMSPLVTLFPADTLRVLKKTIGYEELQTAISDDVYFMSRLGQDYWDSKGISKNLEVRKKTTFQLIEAFTDIGLDYNSVLFLTFICDRYDMWTNYCMIGNQWKFSDPDEFMLRLRLNMKGLVDMHDLNDGSLKVNSP